MGVLVPPASFPCLSRLPRLGWFWRGDAGAAALAHPTAALHWGCCSCAFYACPGQVRGMLLFLDACMVGKKAVSSPCSVLVTSLCVLRRGHSQLRQQRESIGLRAVGTAKIQPVGRDRWLCTAAGACHSREGEGVWHSGFPGKAVFFLPCLWS